MNQFKVTEFFSIYCYVIKYLRAVADISYGPVYETVQTEINSCCFPRGVLNKKMKIEVFSLSPCFCLLSVFILKQQSYLIIKQCLFRALSNYRIM